MIALRLEIPAAAMPRVARALRHSRAGAPVRHAAHSVYFDTPNWKLYRHDLSLCVHRSGKHLIQRIAHLDQYPTGRMHRMKWDEAIKGPRPERAAASRTPLGPLWGSHTRHSLRAIFETRVLSSTYRLERPALRALVQLTQGIVKYKGARKLPFCELQLTLVHGSAGALFDVAKMLSAIVPARLCVRSEAERGYALVHKLPPDAGPHTRLQLSDALHARDAFRLIGRDCVRQLLSCQEGVLAANVEALHQMRVSLRRLRAAISFFKDIVGDRESRAVGAELRSITTALGPARDLDVFYTEVLTPWRKEHRRKPGVTALFREFTQGRKAAFAEAAAAVRSPRFANFALNTLAWVEAGPWTTDRDEMHRMRRERPIMRHVAGELTRRLHKIRRKGRKLQHLSIAKRHQLRIRAKKLRYAIEFVVDLYPAKKSAKQLKEALKGLKDLQTALGSLNDIAAHQYRASGLTSTNKNSGPASPAKKAFAASVMARNRDGRVKRLLDEAQRAYARLLKVKPFWK